MEAIESMTMKTPRERLQAAILGLHEPWGGVLCLDFANTIEPRGGPPPVSAPPGYLFRDELMTYLELVAWTVHKGALPINTGTALIEAANSQPEQAATVLMRAHTLRDAIYRIFWRIAQQQPPPAADLAILAREHAAAAMAADLVAADGEVRWAWPEDGANLARPLWPVAWSATKLVTTGESARIKVCPGTPGQSVPCAWLFYDETKNRSRRWCSMTDCGGVTKARRQTARRRAGKSQE
jgi:predicted RNA-binding Zn ribbon-like protein